MSLFFRSSLQSFACCCELLRAAPPLTREQANPLLSLITKFSSTVCFVDHYIGPTRAKRRRHSHNFFFPRVESAVPGRSAPIGVLPVAISWGASPVSGAPNLPTRNAQLEAALPP